MFGDAISEERQLCCGLFREGQSPVYVFGHEGEWDLSSAVNYAERGDLYFSLSLLPNSGDRHQRGKAVDSKAIGCLWADVDFKNATETAARDFVSALPLKPSAVVNSGNGLHLYWFLDEVWQFEGESERAAADGLLKRWGQALTKFAASCDLKLDNVFELARVLRLPGTLNHKDPNNLKPVELEELNPEQRYSREKVEEFVAEHCPDQVPAQHSGSQTYEPIVTVSATESQRGDVPYDERLKRAEAYGQTLPPSIQGQNGSKAAMWAARVFLWGFDLERHDARQLFDRFNMRCQPPWNDREIEHKLDSASTPFDKPRGWLVQDTFEPTRERYCSDAVMAMVDLSGLTPGSTVGTDGDAADGNGFDASIDGHGPDNPVNDCTTRIAPAFSLDLIDAAAFDATEYKLEWLVRQLLVKGQHCIVGGRKKCMKTSVLIDLAISLSTGTPFLNQFEVETPARTCLISGESGLHKIQETSRRVAAAKGVALGSADLLLGDSLPQFSNAGHLAVVERAVRDHGIEVLIIDPAYLCMLGGDSSSDAYNLFAMGEFLREISSMAIETDCTLVLAHHAKKASAQFRHVELDLEDLSGAGFAEWARQWILLNRRERYAGDGLHRLQMSVGGSAGHGGSYALTIDEGAFQDDFRGLKWETVIEPMDEIERQMEADKEARREARAGVRELAKLDRVRDALREYPDGQTRSHLSDETGINPKTLGKLLEMLQEDLDEIVPCMIEKNGRSYSGFKLKALAEARPDSGTPTTQTDNSDNCLTESPGCM